MIRNTLKYVHRKDMKPITTNLNVIYRALSEKTGEEAAKAAAEK